MPEGFPKQFSSPEEELEYLRDRVAREEQAMLARTPEVDQADIETIARQELRDYSSFTPKMVLDKSHQLQGVELKATEEQIAISNNQVEEIVQVALEKGIKNALTVLEKIPDSYVVDEVHRKLVSLIQSGVNIQQLREGLPMWHLLHMTLYEVTMPEHSSGKEYQLTELVGMMEQFLAGMRTVGLSQKHNHIVLEVAVANHSDDIVFYTAVPNEFSALFEKQLQSLFPQAVLAIQNHDYNIFIDGGTSGVSEMKLEKNSIYPIRVCEEFATDPLPVLLNAFSNIDRDGGGAALQFVIRHPQHDYRKDYESIIKNIRKGMKPSDAISRSTISGELMASVNDLFFKKKETKNNLSDVLPESDVDTQAIELFNKKISSQLYECNVRIVVSSSSQSKVNTYLDQIESTFNQFEVVGSNKAIFKRYPQGAIQKQAIKAFSFREFKPKTSLVFSIDELATMIHYPANGNVASPQFKQNRAKTAPYIGDSATSGTLLGINKHRGIEKKIYMDEQDRMRHFYVIGQTGTGKSVFLKNLIIQDIEQGAGVCMIDPHGTDIEDVIGAIPSERYDDVIYFDPSRQDRVIGLNMLEYDPTKPEQKTFVVNELFSIFQKLYGANPESMGPMFEQYFRNATLLVMDHPESGNTLMDIARVMSDAKFRREKLEKATNPVVVEFWKEIASKAGGEASLENIVPYIVSKFDVFTANDYMRPIIGQQTSAFNFRKIMDERKILLVNLSKGRLGEINANLIGMIFVGKILMAALSRVDDPSKSFSPFYLHIDEFQNVSTNSIASILSEARKYKLGLSMAHQFIAQLEPTIRDAVFGNVGSMAAFRVGNEDADALLPQFDPAFDKNDLMNIPNYQAFMRILSNGTPTKPFTVNTLPPRETNQTDIDALIHMSYMKYGRPLAEIEADIAKRYQKRSVPPPLTSPR